MARTDEYEGMIAETVAIGGAGGDLIHAYYARPAGPGPFPGMVVLHHLPGWTDWYKETTRRFAARGFAAICPDLYCRVAHGDADDVGARVMAEGGVPDEQVIADADGANAFLRSLPVLNGKVGAFGTCSGGRHAYLVACLGQAVDAAVDCWGGRVVMTEEDYNDRVTLNPIDHTDRLQCPLLGLFGEEDHNPDPAQVDQTEAALREHGKDYEFHRYPGAGHGFFYYHRPQAYRAEQAADGWEKVWSFLDRHLR
ncbi:MAG: prolyl oligopeptidase family serine peptidase [Dehalococcoidia bacterium]|nr:prolyl oligopeptidase family serine peptidase [Dehalococcoidia bacterium]MPZ72789.1 prolyl oligopeptidase family serine peptidase [Nitriliruptorales bacterium]